MPGRYSCIICVANPLGHCLFYDHVHCKHGHSQWYDEALACVQFGQRYVEEQDDKTVTEWMRKQVRSPALQIITSCPAGMRKAGLSRKVDLGCRPCPDYAAAVTSD